MPIGKKQKLINARKEIMEDIRRSLEYSSGSEDEYEDQMYINSKDETEYNLKNKMCKEIQQNILDYVVEMNLSLCEYLDTDVLENFIDNNL